MPKKADSRVESYDEVHPDSGKMSYFRKGERPGFTDSGIFLRPKPMRHYIPKNKFYYNHKEFFAKRIEFPLQPLIQHENFKEEYKPRKKRRPKTASEDLGTNEKHKEILQKLVRPKTSSQGLGTYGKRLYNPGNLMYATAVPGVEAMQKKDLHRKAAFANKNDIYLIKSGILPRYQGYVPGMKFRHGSTFGNLSYNAKEIGSGRTFTWGGLTSLSGPS